MQDSLQNVVDFSALEIKVASPDTILSWSHGEIKKPETINYRSLKAEKDGLFDEKIFGPIKDYECYCGKYKRARYKGIVCDKCGVEVTHSRVRRERMGHIDLAAPVAHIWYFKGAPSKLSLLLDISPKSLASIIYFAQYVVLEIDDQQKSENLEQLEVALSESQKELKEKIKEAIVEVQVSLKEEKAALVKKISNKETLELKTEEAELKAKQKVANLKAQLDEQLEQLAEIYATIKKMVKKIKKGTILSEDEYIKLMDYGADTHIRVGMGAESILELVKEIDLDSLVVYLREEIINSKGARKVKMIKRLRVVEGLRKAEINPAWMFLTVLPVIPPDLRPMVQLSGGRFATSDLNDLYRRVINRNNRLKHLIDLGAPDIILRNEKRMLQEAVDSLIDQSNTKRRRQRPLKSLSDMLKGKQGRFRRNLLGKRVDYSGRSVIVVGPELKLNQCGLPKDMALEMYKPYVLRELILNGVAPNVKSARHLIDRREPEVYDILEKVTANHPVILNRAPTLHKLGMQAFYPILVEGKAIRLHPCVCSGYNADFDGDQMAVHLPLTKQAIQEQKDLLMSTQNLLKPANSEPVTMPNKEMAMGIYYQTIMNEDFPEFPTIFTDIDEAFHAHQISLIDLHQPIKVRLMVDKKSEIIRTTIGRIQFNQLLGSNINFINEAITAKKIKGLVTLAIETQPREQITQLIDAIKDLGFEAATLSGISVSVVDCEMIDEKEQIVDQANKKVEKIQASYQEGLITDEERKKLTYQIWMDTTDEVADKTWNSYGKDNAVKIIIDSGGTRASKDQVKQLAAMRGLVVDPLGNIVEMPTKSNFRQGLSIFEYVTSARGSRKGLTDSALKTADAGYLTRRLVDVSHDVIIRQEDCGTSNGVEISKEDTRSSSFEDRVLGRVTLQDIKIGSKIMLKAGEVINPDLAEKLAADEKTTLIKVRSPLTCEAVRGMCAHCYGWDFSTRKIVEIGVPVGVVAAQSIGEPGTQLTMRVKHSGGIVGLDVTQGLPRVEEIFESRNPKSKSLISELTGKVKLSEDNKEITITVVTTSSPKEEVAYKVSLNTALIVENGDLIAAGERLTAGSVNLSELMQIRGLLYAQQYVVDEVQYVYESQGITIHDKHFEVIARKMGDKVKIEKSGDTEFLTGEVVERSQLIQGNDDIMAAGGEPASAKVMLLGITRSALYTHSWLSAASFQHTKSVLTNASAKGAVDYLDGLKENVIIGRLIPTTPERAQIEV